jgi:hypothetical protein
MADNDKYIIIKENESLKLIGGNTKTRAEYEDIVLETINYECSSVLNEIKSVNTKEIAKAVVDRLFGDIR